MSKKIVVVAIVIKDKQALLIRRVHKEPGLDWCFPGGVVEQGETEEQALVREILEETNCLIKPIEKLGQKPHPLNDTMELVYWHCEYVSGNARIMEPHKHEAVEWKDFSEVEKLVERDFESFVTDLFGQFK